jgi:hypothetical protein
VLAQTLSVASERLAAIQAHLAAECAGLHRTFLLIAALSAASADQLVLKTELLDILFVYAEHLLEEITVGRCADVKQLAKLYSIVPALEKASANCGEFHNDIAKSSLEATGCVEINRRFGTSRPNFEIIELGQIEVVLPDFWTNRSLSSSSRSTVKEDGPNFSNTRTLKSG